METANPALGSQAFRGWERATRARDAMTVQGSIFKTAILLLCVLLAAGYTWNIYHKTNSPAAVAPWLMIGMIGGLILALVTVFKKNWAPVTAPLYALFQGLFLGGLSATFDASYPGIVIQAVGLTFATLAAMLLAYESGWIQPTEKFKWGVFAATGGIALLYIATLVLGLFGIHIPAIYDSGWVGIAFSLFVVVIAALNLVIDFDFIEKAAQIGAPKYMEWYGAFALMVTLVWLYLEVLRLLAKVKDQR